MWHPHFSRVSSLDGGGRQCPPPKGRRGLSSTQPTTFLSHPAGDGGAGGDGDGDGDGGDAADKLPHLGFAPRPFRPRVWILQGPRVPLGVAPRSSSCPSEAVVEPYWGHEAAYESCLGRMEVFRVSKETFVTPKPDRACRAPYDFWLEVDLQSLGGTRAHGGCSATTRASWLATSARRSTGRGISSC